MKTTICSGYFRPVKANRPFSQMGGGIGGGNHTFELAAAEKDAEWPTLIVEDMLDRMYLLERKYAEVPVYGEAIARDLVNEWRDSIYGGAHGGPAIFVCKGDRPTAEEKSHWGASQHRWMLWIYAKAEEKALNNKPGDINDLDRDVAKRLGRNPRWIREDPEVSTRPCPLCTTEISSLAAVCPNCNKIIDPQKYMEFMERGSEIRKQIEALERESELDRLTAPGVAAGTAMVPPLEPKQPKKGQPVGA